MIIKGYFSLFLHKNLCCGYSLESPRRGDSNEYPQHMFLWRTDENYPSIINQIPSLSVLLDKRKNLHLLSFFHGIVGDLERAKIIVHGHLLLLMAFFSSVQKLGDGFVIIDDTALILTCVKMKIEPCHKKTCFWGRPGKTQTSLLSYRG